MTREPLEESQSCVELAKLLKEIRIGQSRDLYTAELIAEELVDLIDQIGRIDTVLAYRNQRNWTTTLRLAAEATRNGEVIQIVDERCIPRTNNVLSNLLPPGETRPNMDFTTRQHFVRGQFRRGTNNIRAHPTHIVTSPDVIHLD